MKSSTSSKAWVLGPKAENQEIFEKMLTEAFRDYCYWRRNFHPEDNPYVEAADCLNSEFQKYIGNLHSHLFEMLSHLKRSVPFFSPRYLGHMNTDLLMPGILGYISAMLYNQNNIVQEAATITLQFESEAMQLVAKMLHLPEDLAWGHLCSGGTAANMEALWVARNLRLFPFQVALALSGTEFPADGKNEILSFPVRNNSTYGSILETNRLNSVTVEEIKHLYEYVNKLCAEKPSVAEKIEEKSVGRLGLSKFSELCEQELGENFPTNFKIIVSKNAHYSLKKSAGIIGLGEGNLVTVPLDSYTRMDIDHLRKAVYDTLEKGECIIAVVGVYGSTEEGAIDDFKTILDIRKELRAENKGDYWIHADACYGGYALSMSHPKHNAESLTAFMNDIIKSTGNDELKDEDGWNVDESEDWLKRSIKIGECDSISIDPHKLGYIPYPAGAVFYKDFSVREFMRCDAPYINAALSDKKDEKDIWSTPYLGKYTLEGSRPGAYGAAVWLAHKTIPLDSSGHGFMVAQSVLGARYLQRIIEENLANDAGEGIGCRFLCEKPDLNILCYTFPSKIDGRSVPLSVLNRSVERLYNELLPTELNPTQTREFVVAMTRLDIEDYGEFLNEYLKKLGIPGSLLKKEVLSTEGNPWRDDHKIAFIRTVVMGPFLLHATTRPKMKDHSKSIASEYAKFLRVKLDGIIKDILDEPLPAKQDNDMRPQLTESVLIVEDDFGTSEDLREQLEKTSFRGRGRVFSARNLEEALQIISEREISAALIDIELGPKHSRGGIEFLSEALQKPGFKGGVVFTTFDDENTKQAVEEIMGQHRSHKKVTYRVKPNRLRGRFQAAANEVMEDLWDILST